MVIIQGFFIDIKLHVCYFVGNNNITKGGYIMSSSSTDFESWLKKNTYGNYNGVDVSSESELVAYTYVISLIVVTFRRSTRYYFKDVESGKVMCAKILCTLCNLILGWWGIPWGPIYTIKETFCNLFKPKKCKWGQLIAANRQ